MPISRPRVRFAATLLLVLAGGGVLRGVWRGQLVDPGIGGDALHYWKLAAHLDRDGVFSLDGARPTWIRLPGYSLLLALTTSPGRSITGAMDPESIRVRVDAWLGRLTRVNLAIDLSSSVAVALLALSLAGRGRSGLPSTGADAVGTGAGAPSPAGRLALVAALAWAVQPWSTVIAIHPLCDGFSTALTAFCLAALAWAVRARSEVGFAVAGAIAGAAQLVRPDSLLLLPALLLGAALTDGAARRRAARALTVAVAFAVPFAPWPIRNQVRFGAPHFLGGTGIDARGEPLDRDAAFAWLRTWSTGSERATVGVAWRFPSQPLAIEDVPPEAFDAPGERDAFAALLRDYGARGARLDADLTARLDAITRARRERHPFRCWVSLPVARAAGRLLPPRDGFGMRTLPTLASARPAWLLLDGTLVVLGALALGILAWRRDPLALPVAAWVALRLAMLAWLPAPEPRYALELVPILYAAAAALPAALRGETSR